jgi:hypothetical protein
MTWKIKTYLMLDPECEIVTLSMSAIEKLRGGFNEPWCPIELLLVTAKV